MTQSCHAFKETLETMRNIVFLCLLAKCRGDVVLSGVAYLHVGCHETLTSS